MANNIDDIRFLPFISEYLLYKYEVMNSASKAEIATIRSIGPIRAQVLYLNKKITNPTLEGYLKLTEIPSRIIFKNASLGFYMFRRLVGDAEEIERDTEEKVQQYCTCVFKYLYLIETRPSLAEPTFLSKQARFDEVMEYAEKILYIDKNPFEKANILLILGGALISQENAYSNQTRANELLLQARVQTYLAYENGLDLLPLLKILAYLMTSRKILNRNEDIYRIRAEMIHAIGESMQYWEGNSELQQQINEAKKSLMPIFAILGTKFQYGNITIMTSKREVNRKDDHFIGLLKLPLSHLCEGNPRECNHHCSYCFRYSKEQLLLCGNCGKTCYCDRECQRNFWKFHKGKCAKTTEQEYAEEDVWVFIKNILDIS